MPFAGGLPASMRRDLGAAARGKRPGVARTVAAAILIVSCVTGAAGAQIHRGAIRGAVTDPTGAPLADATIRLVHVATNETRAATSGPDGEFTLSLLPPGAYRLSTEVAGYRRLVRELELRVNQEVRADAELQLGSISEEIVVTAPLLAIERDAAGLRTVIDNAQIVGLPLDGRQFLELSLLVPGTAPAAEGSAGSVRGEFALNVNGAREDANAFLLDGAYNLDPKLNSVGVAPPVDAIEEFAVQTNGYDASFGRNAGGQINVILKSGTNQLHGTAYGFFRNDALDGRNFFAPADEPAPTFERNQFGASLGGPIRSDRTFFFVDYEGRRLREGITRVTNVPTLAERSGDFSNSAFAPPIDPFTQQPFPGGRIPASRIHPVGAAIAALYPGPNRSTPFQNFVSSPILDDRSDHFDARIDHRLGDGSSLAVRYSFSDRDLFEPFSGPTFAAVPGYGTGVPRRGQNLVATYTQIWSPAVVNETRFAYSRVSAGAFHENLGTSLNAAVGLPELSDNPRDFGLSFITVSGFSPLGDEFNNPQQSTTNSFQILNNTTYARGRHLLKFGVDVRGIRQDAFRDVQSRGFLTFSDQVPITGNALADLLLGFPVVTGGAILDNPQRLRTSSYNVYVHDSWRASNALTLSGGVRYELNLPPVDADDRATVYDPETQSLVRVGTQGVPRGGYETDRNNVAPRVGLAWTPTGGGDTVVRGGYGVYYDQSSLAPGEGLYFSAPFFEFNLFLPLPGLPLTLSDPFPATFPFQVPQSALTYQRDLQTAMLHHWNVGVQQQLGGSRMVEVAYVGSRGRNLLAGRDINQPDPSPAPINPRPVPQFDDITAIESRATSTYDALQLRFQQRLHRGVSFLAAYTLSESTDDASNFFPSAGDPNFPQNSHDLAAERGRSNFDVRHRFSFSFGYQLPFGTSRRFLNGHGWASAILGDWDVNGIVTLQSGRPFTAALLPAIDNSNTGRSVLGFGANDRPDVVGNPELADPSPGQWFDARAFAFAPFGSFGNAGRNILEGPGFQNVSLGVLKGIGLSDGVELQLRFEAFNLFDHTNFDLPDNFLGSPTFGQILSARSPRRLQLGAKLIF